MPSQSRQPSQLNREMRNHRLGLVSAILCFLSCLTRTPGADVMWYQDEGLRAVGSSYKKLHELRDRHATINHLTKLDSVPHDSVQIQDYELWRSTSLPSSKQKSALFQSIHARMPKWLTSLGSKRLRRSMVEISPNSVPAPAPQGHSHHHSEGVRWGMGFALGAVLGAIAAVYSAVVLHFILSYRNRTISYRNPVIFNTNITTKMLEFVHKDDVLEGAKFVGEGGSSKVYRVPMDGNIVVAIKSVPRLNPHPADQDKLAPAEGTVLAPNPDAKNILAELDTLGFNRHRNLVQIWAYIYKRDSHLLIYEYIPRGSLRDAFRQMYAGELTLTWPQRHGIMCGVAQGLTCLHNSHGRCIVHRDLKPEDILLTNDLEAKLADFGLAAILPDNASHASTEQLAGTVGYIAPESHQTLRYSQKADIFSFGVVLAHMVTAREPTEDMFIENGGSIGLWLQRCLNLGDNKVEAIDPALRETEYRDEILLAMKVAVFCMGADPQLRPLSSDVLTMLLQIRNPEPVRSCPLSGPLSGPLRSGLRSASGAAGCSFEAHGAISTLNV